MQLIHFLPTLLCFSFAAASPFYPRAPAEFSKDVTHIAIDESGRLVAFNADGQTVGEFSVDNDAAAGLLPPGLAGNNTKRADAASCAPLTVDAVKTLPGWQKIKDFAKSQWGDGKSTVVTNPKDFLNAPANACSADDVINIAPQGSPQCSSDISEVDGKLTGTTGKVTIDFSQGYSNSASWTVTQESSLATAVTLAATISVPEIANFGPSVTTTATISNTHSKTFSTTVDNTHSSSLEMDAPDGKKCAAKVESKACNINGTGKLRIAASGFVWFNFVDKTKGHFKWAVSIENVLKNIDDRSTFIEFTGSMKGTLKSQFDAKCE